MSARNAAPDLLPRLSAGRHRHPRQGACFMEFASYLAGERWSDHPPCTDRVLSALARDVNDLLPDGRRDALVELIPRVIGLRTDDARLALLIALRAAAAALPIASMERQRALAVAVIATTDALAARGTDPGAAGVVGRSALAETPDAARWAREHLAVWAVHPLDLVHRGCEAIVHSAAVGIAQACVDDAEERLEALLRDAVADAEQLIARRSLPAVERVLLPA